MNVYNDLRIAPFSALLDSQIGLPDHQGGPDFVNWNDEIESRHCRNGYSPICMKPKPSVRDLDYIKGEFAYIGPLCQHFGHQVADFSMRILPTLTTGFDGPIIVGSKESGPSDFSRTPKYFQQIISWFQIPSNRIILSKTDLIFEKVNIAPQAETIFGPVPSTEHLDALSEHYSKQLFGFKSSAESSKIVYISRSRIRRGVFAGEDAIERYMRIIGARILFPELEKISDLLQIYNNAEYIVGSEGSAFHLMQLLGKQLKNIVIIKRRADLTFFGDNFIRCRCKNLKYIDAVIGGVSGRADGRYREEGLVLLDFDRLSQGLREALPIKEPMNKLDFEKDKKDSVSRWLMNYWYDASTFTENSLDIIIAEAKEANLIIDPEDLDVAKTKSSRVTSDTLRKTITERNPKSDLHIREIRVAINLGVSGDRAGLNVLQCSLNSNDVDWVDYGNVALAAYRLSEYQLAHKAVLRALEESPNMFWLWELKTHILVSKQDWQGAEKSALMGLSLDSSRPDLLFLLSTIRLKIGALNLALVAIDDALKHQSKPHFIQLRCAIENLINKKERIRVMIDNDYKNTAIDSQALNTSVYKTHTSRRVNRLADVLCAKSYLEVGVFEGLTFNDVRIEKKIAVDPLFRFDTSEYSVPGKIDFIQKQSDMWFLDAPLSLKFDIIFLDGLHTYQQTLRDLLNSLAHCHDKSLVIIDDVWPVDIFSALPKSSDAHEFRRNSGGNSLAWHGDVFKVIFFINDFMPSLSYCTIRDGGNAQTLVWSSPRSNFTPRFNSTEIIERLDYVALHRNIDIMNFVSEEDALSKIKEMYRFAK